MKEFFTIYNQRLAGYLMLNGFSLINIIRNRSTNRNNFLFVNSDALRDYIDKWQIEKLEKLYNKR